MAQDPEIPPDSFDEILAWLDPDREVAANLYVRLRADLTNIFKWKGCADPDGLTDEVFDRVGKKVHELRPTYEGDPRLYFRAVANNLIKEDFKKVRIQVSLEDLLDLPQPATSEDVDEEAVDMDECLRSCLQKLSAKNRDLIVGYYAKEKQAKIDRRSELARQLGVTVPTLRVRAFRIREGLQKCIEDCLKRQGNCE
ncbi:MAG TPA: sigma-70 family RNA polymerase sigma factor [Pyrinomonadaceae bacterium]|nr:sigma-70 family RNA polymerase sigma factor [Pyrinomonadaceae bacterium]